IALAVSGVRSAANIRRQRRLAEPFDQLTDRLLGEKPYNAFSEITVRQNLGTKMIVEDDPITRAEALARFCQDIPLRFLFVYGADQENFHFCPEFIIEAAM